MAENTESKHKHRVDDDDVDIRTKTINDSTPATSDSEQDDEGNIPEEFICPLTLEVFTDPLMDRRGINFERSAIVEWLNRGHTTCPLTREPLGYRSLIPNVNLRVRVEHWKREHGYETHSNGLEEKKTTEFVAMIEAPPNSPLETRWMRDLEQQAQSFPRSSRRRRRHHQRQLSLLGLSPATRQRRLTGMLGDALSMIRRPPLTES
mmetsp:Transcript_5897/g.10199  ORF Transcript_5897/g.10199 Transcript_5897/m.10199 type:complete len:206 (+) Transcript_5897:298-915(+)